MPDCFFPYINNGHARCGWLDSDSRNGQTGIKWTDTGRDFATCLRGANMNFQSQLAIGMAKKETADGEIWEASKSTTDPPNTYAILWDPFTDLMGGGYFFGPVKVEICVGHSTHGVTLRDDWGRKVAD